MAQGPPAPLDVFRVRRTRGPLCGPSAFGVLNASLLLNHIVAVGASIFSPVKWGGDKTCKLGTCSNAL